MSRGRPPKPRSPQEKKALSYERDCRNVYRQNDKASRKLIPIRKAQSQRRLRRKVEQDLSVIAQVDEAAADLIESDARSDIRRVEAWQKGPDMPLGEHIVWQDRMAEFREGRKERARKARVEKKPIIRLRPRRSR
jgi:hypothetical protein